MSPRRARRHRARRRVRAAPRRGGRCDRGAAPRPATDTGREWEACSDRCPPHRPGTRTGIPALPFYQRRLTARKPVPSTVMAEPRTWGEHLRRQRILRGLTQQKVANEIRVSPDTIIHWEKGKTAPQVRHLPRVIAFLRYSPWTPPRHPGERFRQARVALGLTQEASARRIGV